MLKKILLTLVPVLALLLSVHCGKKEEKAAGAESETEQTEALAAEPDEKDYEEPLSIDPNREEEILTGTPGERLLAKYELLVERIRLERQENVFNAVRSSNLGLVPLAKEHHRLFEEGVFDSTLTLEFIHLAEFVLMHHIYKNDDRSGRKATERFDRVRAMLPDHETPPGSN